MLNPEQVKIELARLAAERQALADEYDRRMESLAQKIKENPTLAKTATVSSIDPITGRYRALCTR